MSKCVRYERSLVFISGLLLLSLVAGSFRVSAQAPSASILVKPPIHTKGLAQPSVVGLTPSQIRRTYGFDQISNQGAGQTIGIIEAFGHPQIERDLATFSETFNLPPCTTSNGCFQKIFSTAKHPGTDQLWALETALDVEWAHAIAPQARIMLVEAPSDTLNDLMQAVDVAVSLGATVISMSWRTVSEFAGEGDFDNHFIAANISFVASSGDCGAGVPSSSSFCGGTGYPAVSPYVTAVGGTTLSVDKQGNYLGEVAWGLSGGGLSDFEPEPGYQRDFPLRNNPSVKRGTPDVAYNADPDSGFAVYTTIGYQGFRGWIQVGGTSAGAPQWAALLAIARSMGWSPLAGNNAWGSNTALYAAASTSTSFKNNYHDITSGSNGDCLSCSATKGYDYVTGLGSPQAAKLVKAMVTAVTAR